jgi:NADPH2:quinone reductase
VRRDTGERVCATTLFGGFAEVAAAPAFLCFPIPDAMPFDVAAALVVNYQTAHLGLTRRGRMQPGETVLVHGAAGGVGTAAIQVAKALGAGRVIGVARGEEKARVAAEAGADDVVQAEGDWVAAVRELGGADVVVDPVGGDRFDQSLRCMRPEGRLLVVGFAEGRIPTLPVNRLLLRHLDVVGVNFGGMVPLDQEFPQAAAADLFRWWEEGTVRPVIGARHPLEDGAKALHDFAERRVVGKPVLSTR